MTDKDALIRELVKLAQVFRASVTYSEWLGKNFFDVENASEVIAKIDSLTEKAKAAGYGA